MYKQHWIGLPGEVRTALAGAFKMSRSERTEVFDNRIVSDGYSDEAIANISVKNMQDFLISKEETFSTLLTMTVDRLLGREVAKVEESVAEPVVENIKPEPVEEPVVEKFAGVAQNKHKKNKKKSK